MGVFGRIRVLVCDLRAFGAAARNSTKARETERRARTSAMQPQPCRDPAHDLLDGEGVQIRARGGELFSRPSDLADQLPNPPLICSEGRGIAVEKPEEIVFENRSGSDRVAQITKGAKKIPC